MESPLVFIEITNELGEIEYARIDVITSIGARTEGGSLVWLGEEQCLAVQETPTEVMDRMSRAFHRAHTIA
jgi:hypothetical protein